MSLNLQNLDYYSNETTLKEEKQTGRYKMTSAGLQAIIRIKTLISAGKKVMVILAESKVNSGVIFTPF